MKRLVMWLLKQPLIPLRIRFHLLADLPFGWSPFEKVELPDSVRKSAIEYFKTGKQP